MRSAAHITMLGYWRNDAANEDTILPGRWVASGDFGRLEDGVLTIASRRRDLIIRGGENIYPFEIEDRLEEHPDVVEAAVFGVDDATHGQIVKAVVVRARGHRARSPTSCAASAPRPSPRTRSRPTWRSAPPRSPATPPGR